MPPALAKLLFVKLLVSSAIDTSERKSMSRLQVTLTSGSWIVWSRRSSSPIRNTPVPSMVRLS
jgi:hypothetical protein